LRTPPSQAATAAIVRPPSAPAPAAATKPWLSADKVLFVSVCALLYFGWHFPTERYISPKRGVGYALGIVGGSLMLLLLVYSLRKRWSWLRFLGSTPSWFRFHMVLGVLGPLCILYRSEFSTGATNSNVALFCMLTVAGSGLIGRLFTPTSTTGFMDANSYWANCVKVPRVCTHTPASVFCPSWRRASMLPSSGCCGPVRACRCLGCSSR
jgi:hypothetical protein